MLTCEIAEFVNRDWQACELNCWSNFFVEQKNYARSYIIGYSGTISLQWIEIDLYTFELYTQNKY